MSNDQFDPKSLRVEIPAAIKSMRPLEVKIRQLRTRRFILGPIDLEWLSRAAAIEGKSINVALALSYLAGLTKNTTIKLRRTELTHLNVGRGAAYRCVTAMELAGLVRVQKRSGKAPLVTIVDLSEKAST